MSEKSLKIVGGSRDGEWWIIQDGRSGCPIPDPRPMMPVSIHSDVMPEAIANDRLVLHTVRTLGAGGNRMQFLAPADMTDWEALEHQFKK